MQLTKQRLFGIAAALVSLAVCVSSVRISHAQVTAPPPPEPGITAEGVETLTRGPVHEAFAAPSAKDPEPTDKVAKKPPEPIDEEAPELKPEGAIWIPGYWEWDVATENFIWISGLWRVPPPGMRWVPPYWTEVDGGWQRVPGFWMSADVAELEYREPPPASLDVGPSTPAPGENYFYVPGNWSYYDTGYRWRTGYWSPYRADWCWVPSRWHWTPAGCVYNGGYWDYRPLYRGHLFAPIAFHSPVYLRPGWSYRPWCVLDTNRLFVHLWIGPRFGNYYFGNYYGHHHHHYGFTPWSHWHYGHRHGYDPLWSWANVHYRRQGVDYIGRVKGWHDHYERHEDERPARNWDEQRRLIADGRGGDRDRGQNILAADLRDVARREDQPIRLARVDDRERERVRSVSDEIRQLHVERSRLEGEARVAARIDTDRPRTAEAGRGEDRPATADRPGREDRPGAEAAADRGGRRTARISLPKPSEQVRDAARTADKPPSLDTDRPGRETGRTARSSDERGEDRPGRERGAGSDASRAAQDRIRAAREAADAARTARGGEDRPEPRLDRSDARPDRTTEPRATEPRATEPRTTEPRTGDSDRGPTDRPGSDSGPSVQDRIRAAREAAEAGRAARESRGPTERPAPRIERPETPRVETPRVERSETPRAETPRIERTETPRVERSEAPRPETRRVEPRVETPRVETPRVERRTETPRVEAPRVERRAETPRVETPRVETRRAETPRVERSSPPRVERSSPPRVERSSSPRVESSRGSSSSSRGSSGRSSSGSSSRGSSGRGRDRDRD